LLQMLLQAARCFWRGAFVSCWGSCGNAASFEDSEALSRFKPCLAAILAFFWARTLQRLAVCFPSKFDGISGGA
jgi:hypothetical protein